MNIIYVIFFLLFSNCENSSNDNLVKNNSLDNLNKKEFLISGHWEYSKELFLREANKSNEPMIDLSEVSTIQMKINSDKTYISYFGKQVKNGKWKINNNVLLMKRDDSSSWLEYKYTLNKNELIIFDRNYIIALKRIYQ